MSEENLQPKPETMDQICMADCPACLSGDKIFPRRFPPHKKWVAQTGVCKEEEAPSSNQP